MSWETFNEEGFRTLHDVQSFRGVRNPARSQNARFSLAHRLAATFSGAGNGMSAMRVLRFASAARAGSVSRPSSLWRPRSFDPPSEIDERFKKCPWLFKKGNTTGAHRQKRSQVRLRMENLIQRLTDNGDVIVQFFCAVASGQPFMMRYVEKLPRTPEQEAVAQGIATPEQKAAAGSAQER